MNAVLQFILELLVALIIVAVTKAGNGRAPTSVLDIHNPVIGVIAIRARCAVPIATACDSIAQVIAVPHDRGWEGVLNMIEARPRVSLFYDHAAAGIGDSACASGNIVAVVNDSAILRGLHDAVCPIVCETQGPPATLGGKHPSGQVVAKRVVDRARV